ncbi:hypothetical protein N7490_004417 [Penicillium lividum]|nr:hypothetical protein N7490_004417 [Penicillium lividum]
MSIIKHYSEGPQNDFSRGPHWNHESPFLPVDWETTQKRGAPSLKHAAMKRVLRDQSELRSEMFADIPWIIAEYLWQCLENCNKRTMHMWKIMTTVYPQFREGHPHYHLVTDNCNMKKPLRQYFEIMNSNTCQWRAILSVTHNFTDVADFLAIANVTNLVSLHITSAKSRKDDSLLGTPVQTTDGIQDGVIRSWLEMAETQGSLQHLRVLRLGRQGNLTPHVLPLLRELPELQYIVICQCDHFTRKLSRYHPIDRQDWIMIDGWIVRRMDWIVEKHGQQKAMDELMAIEKIYAHGPDDFLDFAGMEPLKPHSLGLDLPLMEFELSGGFQGPGECSSWDTFFLVRAVCEPSREKKRAPGEISGPGKKKRVMKDRGQDLAGVLGQFM